MTLHGFSGVQVDFLKRFLEENEKKLLFSGYNKNDAIRAGLSYLSLEYIYILGHTLLRSKYCAHFIPRYSAIVVEIKGSKGGVDSIQ